MTAQSEESSRCSAVTARAMEKADVKNQEAQSDTSSVINMKEYAPSEYPSSEPPPAYMKPRHNSLRIARLAAFTVITSAVILGGFILAASWIQANTARNLDLTLNQELMDDLHPSYEHLIANELLPEQQDNNINQNNVEEKKQEPQPQQDSQVPSQQEDQGQDEKPSLELDAIANMLVQKGLRGRVNCIVEKRRNEELVDHAARELSLPFGLNITTAPRLQHLTGEQMVVICKDDNEDKEEEKEEQEQPMFLPIPHQLLAQLHQGPQMIPLAHILQHLQQPQQQQQIFVPQQQQQPQEQQVFYQPQHFFQPQQQQQQMFVPQQQQQQQQQQQPQPFLRQFFPFFHRNQQMPQQQQQQPMPLREVPLSQLMQQRMPINPMAIQDVPMNQMPLTHMPMREAVREQRMQEQPIPVHHLVPPRPQQMRIENYGQEEPEIPAFIRERLMQREREMQQRPRPLPLESREPRIMRGPIFPINDNALPDFPRREENQPAFPPRFPPGRRFRFPDSPDVQGVSITRIIPIRLEKESSEEESTNINNEERHEFPIPLKAILDTVFKTFVGQRQVPIDIKIERIENKAMMDNSESDESQESQEVSQESQEENEEEMKPEQEAKVQQVEIVEKQGENTQAIPIPADAREAQIFKMEDLPEEARAFLPNGLGRGGVFPIPRSHDAQIFTVSDARAGVPVRADYEVSNDKIEETATDAPAVGQPEGEVNLFPVPMEPEQSVRLYPVVDDSEKPQEQVGEMKMEQGEQAEESRPHSMQPRSV